MKLEAPSKASENRNAEHLSSLLHLALLQLTFRWITSIINQEIYYIKFHINLLAPDLFFFLILAHPVYKMWIIQEPNTLELWNKLDFEEKKTENIYRV